MSRAPRSAAAAACVLSLAALACATPSQGAATPASVAAAEPGSSSGTLAVRARTLYTLAGPAITDGLIWIEGGKIRALGRASEIRLPEGIEVLEAAVATPGLVDARSSLGLAGSWNIPHDQDEVDRSGPIQPELRALDAYNPREPLIEWVRSLGVTSVHTGHAPEALVSGQTMVVKLRGRTVAEAVLVPEAMVACALGDPARQGEKAPGTRARTAASLRAALVAAQEARAKRERPRKEDEPEPARDLRQESLVRVLEGTTPLLVHAQRAHDIATALRIAGEFPGLRLVLEGAAEAPLMLEELRAAGVPILLHPTMQRPVGDAEASSFETAKLLVAAGLSVALQSGYEAYVPRSRIVLFEAAIAARHGLPFEDALALITREPARLLGLSERIGTLEVGKDGDVALYDGDPFEYATHCVGVVIDGRRYPGEQELQRQREAR